VMTSVLRDVLRPYSLVATSVKPFGCKDGRRANWRSENVIVPAVPSSNPKTFLFSLSSSDRGVEAIGLAREQEQRQAWCWL